MKKLFTAVMLVLCSAAMSAAGDRLDAARLLLFDRDWPRAVVELRRVVADKKEKAPLRAEAALWLAHSLFQMGNAGEALRVIEMLEKDHPRSQWVLPAQSLRVEIAAQTDRPDVLWRFAVPPAPPALPRTPMTPRAAIAPPPPQTPPPSPRAIAPRAATRVFAPTTVDVQIEALRGLIRTEPDRAVPVLREIVVHDQETPQARRALFVLGLSTHDDARQTVMQFAQRGPESLRVVAISQLARWPTADARQVLASSYAAQSGRVKLAVLRSLGEARADRELIRLARAETDADLKGYAHAQLRAVDTPAARAYLNSIK